MERKFQIKQVVWEALAHITLFTVPFGIQFSLRWRFVITQKLTISLTPWHTITIAKPVYNYAVKLRRTIYYNYIFICLLCARKDLRRLAQWLRMARWSEWGSLNLEDIFYLKWRVSWPLVVGPFSLSPTLWQMISRWELVLSISCGSYFWFLIRLCVKLPVRWNTEKASLKFKYDSYYVLFTSWPSLCTIYNSQKLNSEERNFTY